MNLQSPHALARCTHSASARLPLRRRVGRYTAGAANEAVFESFLDLAANAANEALTDPIRILTMRHLSNATAYRMPDLEDSTRVLIDGVLAELIARQSFARIFIALPRTNPFHVICAPGVSYLISRAVGCLLAEMASASEGISEDRAFGVLPVEITEYPSNVRTLMASIVAAGRAYWDVGQNEIRRPRASSLR